MIALLAAVLLIIMLVSSHNKSRNIKAYRNLTLERHEKEKAFSMDYYYTRHPDRRPKEDASAGQKKAGNGKKTGPGGKEKRKKK